MTSNLADQMVETFAGAGVERIHDIVDDSLNGITDGLRRRGGAELIALIEALARRAVETRETKLQVGQLELDLIERTAKRNGRPIDLLPREFRLLEYMMRRKGRILTREMLFREVWNYKFDPKTNLVDVHSFLCYCVRSGFVYCVCKLMNWLRQDRPDYDAQHLGIRLREVQQLG